ncbi:MAG: hypothetical protein JGK12_16410 [Microcoleus sp. PH2017_01_SCD_O_A]|uniref:hypothetical protein n=1 Tax=unclassified Microcoleus TaxID=2642155 RepID=UPI001D798FB8|nr:MULTISPECIES: hypothetical protein [unclassified Microcoleus]MCC3425471.1 hypothetical protein [Microcoleus sp. PH2017_01_SCD_O_A]MCC3571962.1 hypothetical protein [Microcoleus sp. PH2017_34_RAT_O_A]MCC3609572.1 hypothetical protein [Microcoleus sp. PH2017_40_RAT_O_B]
MPIQKNQPQKATQKFVWRVIASAFILQAAIIGVKGNLDVVSGKPALDVIQGMIFQGIELIIKANRSRKNVEKIDRPYQPRITPNPDN